MPSKTFHFGPETEEVLGDLFESHLLLTSLLEASTGITAAVPLSRTEVAGVIEEADIRWLQAIRQHWPQRASE